MKALQSLTAGSLILLLAACSNGSDDSNAATDSTASNTGLEAATTVSENTPDTMCFLRTDGLKNQDTERVQLIIVAGKVTGTMQYLPSEKDRRVGQVNGTKDGDDIKLVWSYMQEGMDNTSDVIFKLDGDKLKQKRWAYDAKTGKEYVPDTATYGNEWKQMDCAIMQR